MLSDGKMVWLFKRQSGYGKPWLEFLIYLAAIAGIDGELYDAASIDGADVSIISCILSYRV
jgi:ABC-type polysaccharide transport system permease subunit